MILDPGELDQRILIQQEVTTSDGSGGQTKTWQTVHGPIWAKVRPQSGAERSRSDQVQAEAKYMVFIHNRAIEESYRIVWESNGGRILNIRYVARSPRDLYIKIEAEEGVTQ